nr:RICIN domain-containing protein [Microbacterium amylolyticum]
MKIFPKGHRPARRRLVASFLSAALAVSALTLAAAPAAHAATVDENTEYVLVNRHSGLVADVLNASTENGASIVQFTRTDEAWQRWRFESMGSDYYRIVSAHSGKAIDVSRSSMDNGADIVQYTPHERANQQFRLVDTNGGVQLINRNSGKALEVWERSGAPLARLSQYNANSGNNQVWDLVPAASTCGAGAFDAEAVKNGNTWTVRRGGNVVHTGTDMLAALNAGTASLTPNRTQKQRLVVRGSGTISASDRFAIPSYTILDLCGTITATGEGRGDRSPIYARGVNDIEIRHAGIAGTAWYGIFMRDVRNVILGQIDIDGGGLGIRIDNHSGDRSVPVRNVRIDDVRVSNTGGHGVETYGVDGLTIGSITARNVGGSGLLLNATVNADVGLIDAVGAGTGTGYAAFRMANANGRLSNGSFATNVYVDRVVARGGGRGVFCVSQSGGAEIRSVDIANTGNHSVLIENCYNVKIGTNGGTIAGPGHVRLAARSEFPNNRDITLENLSLRDTTITENPCGQNSVFRNLTRVNTPMNVC